MTIAEQILYLTRKLYPTGRAFKMSEDGYLHKLHRALLVSEAQAYEDAISTLNSILPDNDNFTEGDATDWERRLGLITNLALSLADRKLAIKRKMNHPGDVLYQSNSKYMEGQLQAAGFDVYVYDNRFLFYPGDYEPLNPLTLTGGTGAYTYQHGDFQHGDLQHGITFDNIVANRIDEDEDFKFNAQGNLNSTFFVGGSPVGTYANVDINRKDEFRQMILKIKPLQTVGFLFINYT